MGEVAAEMNGSVGSRIVVDLGGTRQVVGDPAEIRQVLTNLIINADEAMDRD